MAEETSNERRDAENDNGNFAPEERGGGFVADIVMGLRFYSRLPAGSREHEAPNLSRMAQALPFTSLIIGVVPALILAAGAWAGMPPLFAAALAVAAYILVTGAMADDAIADAADGLFGGQTPARRLEILKDSRHGSYGVAALTLYVILRVTALAGLAVIHPLTAALIWLAATTLARSGALWLVLSLPPARRDGASAAAGGVTRAAFGLGATFALILGFVLAAPFTGVLGLVLAVALLVFVAVGWVRLCRAYVGGQTGDLIGALQALLEITALGTFIVFAGH